MNRHLKLIFAFAFLAALIPVLAPIAAARPSGKKEPKKKSETNAAAIDRGQQVFDENCSRCHNPPGSFPPQISGTVLRHMRVRASLSAADERALLRFMNP
jgi:mono/diheme cytochrome c family protein